MEPGSERLKVWHNIKFKLPAGFLKNKLKISVGFIYKVSLKRDILRAKIRVKMKNPDLDLKVQTISRLIYLDSDFQF